MSMSQAALNEKTVSTAAMAEKVLIFALGEERYAVPLLKVKEVIALNEITPVPFAPPYFRGIMNLRGQVISVIDLRLKLGQKNPVFNSETAVVILDLSPLSLGVIVDTVDSVHTVTEKELQPPPDIKTKKESDCISAVIKRDKQLILLLEIARALSVEDLATIKAEAAKVAS